jgi:GLPGLI family protein
MRFNLFIAVLFLGYIWPCSLFTQSIVGKVNYVINTKLDSDEISGEYCMYFNNTQSYVFNQTMPAKGGLTWVNENNGIYKRGDPDGMPLYKNITENLSEQKVVLGTFNNFCILQDTLPKIKWKMWPEYKTIAKYQVQKATGFYGGRIYDVWFTMDIPVSHGPFRLHGLPGLILEANSRDNKIKVEFKKIEFSNEYSPYIVALHDKIAFEVLNYKDYIIKRKIMEDKLALLINGDGAKLTTRDNTKDYQVEKDYY